MSRARRDGAGGRELARVDARRPRAAARSTGSCDAPIGRLRLGRIGPGGAGLLTTRRCWQSCAAGRRRRAHGRRASRSCRRAITWRRAGWPPRVMLARGWERQLDVDRNGLFYGAPAAQDAAATARGCPTHAIAYVALPDAPLDYSGERRGAPRAQRGPHYLREVWRSRHWRLFEVRGAAPLAQPPSAVTRLSSDSFTLRAPDAGTLRRARALHVLLGARRRARLRAPRARAAGPTCRLARGGSVRVVIDFSLARVFERRPALSLRASRTRLDSCRRRAVARVV